VSAGTGTPAVLLVGALGKARRAEAVGKVGIKPRERIQMHGRVYRQTVKFVGIGAVCRKLKNAFGALELIGGKLPQQSKLGLVYHLLCSFLSKKHTLCVLAFQWYGPSIAHGAGRKMSKIVGYGKNLQKPGADGPMKGYRAMDMKKILKMSVPVLLILAAIVCSLLPEKEQPSETYSDISGHPEAAAIEKWSERGVLTGAYGEFRPDDGMTTAELATVMTRVLPLRTMAKNTFSDVDSNEWYAEAVLKCVDAGIIEAAPGSAIGVADPVSRETAYMMFSRAFGVEGDGDTAFLEEYNDYKNISGDALPVFAAFLKKGLISPRSANQLYPADPISRAEVVSLLDKLELNGYLKMD
jgi:hypothetical protein